VFKIAFSDNAEQLLKRTPDPASEQLPALQDIEGLDKKWPV
jgi:hypothetical protein